MRSMYLPKEKLRAKLDIYVSAPERGQIEEKAAAARLPLSAFVRNAALGIAMPVVPTGSIERWRDLARVAGNLNQLAHAINEGRATGVDIDTIAALSEQVRLLRLELVGGALPRRPE